MRAPLPLLGTILLAGCFTHPANAPHPQSVVPAGTPVGRAKTDSSHAATATTTTTKIGTWTTEVSTRDVAQRAAEVFGDSMSGAAPKVSEETEPTWDMDVRAYETQDRVAYYVNMFSGRSRERIADRLERGTRSVNGRKNRRTLC